MGEDFNFLIYTGSFTFMSCIECNNSIRPYPVLAWLYSLLSKTDITVCYCVRPYITLYIVIKT